MKRGFFSNEVPVTAVEITAQQKKNIADLETQKQTIIVDLDKKIAALKNDLKNIENVFFNDYRVRIEAYTKRVSDLADAEAAFDEKTRQLEKVKKDLDTAILLFHNDKSLTLGNIAAQISENKALLQQIAVDKKRTIDNLAEIEKQKVVLGSLSNDLSEREKAAEALENKANDLLADAKNQMADVEKKMIVADSRIRLANEAEQRSLDARFTAEHEKKSLSLVIEDNEAKIKELDSKIAEHRDIIVKQQSDLDTINAEKERNVRVNVALKARDITLSEKERLLNERENSVKVIEKSLSGNASADIDISIDKEKNIQMGLSLKAREIAVNEKERSLTERENNVKILENKFNEQPK